MNYGEIKKFDIANGTGIRVSLFVSGCTHRCPGCFNPQTWDFSFGKEFTKAEEDLIIDLLGQEHISGLTLLGGEPMEKVNQKALLPFLERVKNACPEKTLWIYSGYTFEELASGRAKTDETQRILQLTDVLVDGRFEEDKKNLSLAFRGSKNQRIIDVQGSLKENKVILWEK